MSAIQYDVSIKASQYARYYFELRELAERFDRDWTLRPLSIREAQRLEAKTRGTESNGLQLGAPMTPLSVSFHTTQSSPQSDGNESTIHASSEWGVLRRAMSDNVFEPKTPAALM